MIKKKKNSCCTRLVISIALAISLFYSCDSEMLKVETIKHSQPSVFYTYPEQVHANDIHPEAAQYYDNLSSLAVWYAKNPFFRNLPGKMVVERSENSVLSKFESLQLIDSLGNKVSIFDLNIDELKNFLENWSNVEAHSLTRKIEKDTSANSIALFAERNCAFAKAGIDLKSTTNAEDPFYKIKLELDNVEKGKIENQKQLPILKSEGLTEDYFWATVVANGLMSLSVIQAGPNELLPQTFVDHLRPNIAKGNILLALPGGWTTISPIVFYPNKIWFDVGHVAIIEKDIDQIPDSIDTQFTFTIGTGVDGTHHEITAEKWCKKHGLAFVCQVCSSSWEMYKNETDKKWKWRKVSVVADGEKIIEIANSYLNVPYCNVFDVFFSKWAAPKSFICSSLAWYCAREASGLDISDWWSTSVFPVDIFFSENIRVVDDTLE